MFVATVMQPIPVLEIFLGRSRTGPKKWVVILGSMAHGGEEIGYFGTKREAEAHARWSARILQKRKIFSLAIKAKEALSVLTAEMNPAAKEAGELLEKLEK